MPKVSELPVASPATVRALRDVVIGAETITTGASPVAADPDAGITYIITGGTADYEYVTLALPSDPETKLGTKKRFVMRTLTNGDDSFTVDNTNLVNAQGSQLSATHLFPYYNNDWVEFELIYTALNVFAWQIAAQVRHGVRTNYSAGLNEANGADAHLGVAAGPGESAFLRGANGPSDGGGVSFTGGDGASGAGGGVYFNPGSGTTDGGDFVVELVAAGSGRQSLFRVHNMPIVDPGIADPTLIGKAVWLNSGVLTISAG